MRQLAQVFLTLALLACCGQVASAAWTWETQVLSSPYHDFRLFHFQLGVTWPVQDQLSLALKLPVQLGVEPSGPRLELLPAQGSVAFSWPLREELTSELALELGVRREQLALRGGVKLVFDPLALKCSLLIQEEVTLQAGVTFAANERWALGAHLSYRKNSLLTYELHHSTAGARQLTFSYTQALDGSVQSLGVKITF